MTPEDFLEQLHTISEDFQDSDSDDEIDSLCSNLESLIAEWDGRWGQEVNS